MWLRVPTAAQACRSWALDAALGCRVYCRHAMKSPAPESASIAAGAISALGASTCCMLPLALVSAGLGGAWVAQLRSLERFYPVFVSLAIAAFCYAFYRLYLKRARCATDAETGCAVPVSRRGQRIAFWATLVAAKTLILFPIAYGYFAA